MNNVIGYYRVNYDIKNWEKISNYLHSEEFTNIHVLNRAQIIDDLYGFVDGRISGFFFMDLIKYLLREVDYVAWYPFLFRVIPLIKNYIFLPEATYVKITIMTLLSYLLRNIGYLENTDDDHITKQIRLEAIKWACTIDDKLCKNIIAFKLNQHLADPELYRILPGHNFMYCIGLMAANRTTWDKMLELYQNTDSKKEKFKKTLLTSLSCSENSDIIINYLNITAFNTSLFHEKERSFIIKSILDKHSNNNLILDYILNNFETVKPKSLTTTLIIKLILRKVFYDDQIDKIKVFSDANFDHDPETRNAIKTLIQKRENLLKESLETFKKRFF